MRGQLTTTNKAEFLIHQLGEFNKKSLSEELGISRPTLDTRLSEGNWKLLEGKWISKLYKEKYEDKRG